ncbi:MAG: branched-chain amino acid ABC transporter permease [Hyphomicrobiales bacterium]|nr:branched-chain amino acid ABC transporter permease [Hyphomicrobiales bacterium]MBV8825963.1 branched-chain amino acid ABC transporter permease [Hyphomicrobiales bacterium]MBV9428550.1 branched-chain amino acid ABC transporter permease [Bradyrhizobiaceae bacterium]
MANTAISILFDGVAYAMFLFIVSVGLSVTMGLMGFVNLAHGAFAMAGGYLVVTATQSFGVPFPLALVIAAVAIGAVSILFERTLYAGLYGASELDQVLMTIGLTFMVIAAITYFYGPLPEHVRMPDYLTGEINLGFRSFPTYRVFIIVIGAVLVAVLWYGFERTSLGAKIRAAVDNHRMAQSIGIDVARLFRISFALGSGLAALGGGLAIQLFGLTPSFAILYLVFFLLVVAVGGSGTLWGTLIAALVLGICDTAGKYLYADAGGFFIYAVAVAILLIKPAGLYGRG